MTVTVQELIDLLMTCKKDAIVVMSSDAEGNTHSPFFSLWEGMYLADSTWSGEVGFSELTKELKAEGYTKEDILKGGVSAVILCPTN